MASEREVVSYPAGAVARGLGSQAVIPAGVKVPWHGKGSIVYSSMLSGRDERTSQIPADIEKEIQTLLGHVAGFMKAAGGSVDNVIDATFFLIDEASHTPALEREWSRVFPNRDKQPPHHVFTAAPVGFAEERVGAVIVGCV